MTAPQLLTVEEVAKRLKLSERQVRRLLAVGDLRSTRMGRSVRVSEPELAKYVDRSTFGAIPV